MCIIECVYSTQVCVRALHLRQLIRIGTGTGFVVAPGLPGWLVPVQLGLLLHSCSCWTHRQAKDYDDGLHPYHPCRHRSLRSTAGLLTAMLHELGYLWRRSYHNFQLKGMRLSWLTIVVSRRTSRFTTARQACDFHPLRAAEQSSGHRVPPASIML